MHFSVKSYASIFEVNIFHKFSGGCAAEIHASWVTVQRSLRPAKGSCFLYGFMQLPLQGASYLMA